MHFPLFLAATLCVLSTLRAQTSSPTAISADLYVSTSPNCNNAGTINSFTVKGQSKDTDAPKIFLCWGDTLFVQHNGDADLQFDPNTNTSSGIGYAIYHCKPTVSGDTYQTITDGGCAYRPNPWIRLVRGEPNGDAFFANTGAFTHEYSFTYTGTPQPMELWFAPITLTDFEDTDKAWDNNSCVHVNVDAAFKVSFALPFEFYDFTLEDCVLRFKPDGGVLDFDDSKSLDIDIDNISDPTVDINRLTVFDSFSHSNYQLFSVEGSGVYHLSMEDSKGCFVEQIFSWNCDPSENVDLYIPDATVAQNQILTVPVRVNSPHTMTGMNFSVGYDQSKYQFLTFRNQKPQQHDLYANLFADSVGRLGFLMIPFNLVSLDFVPNDTILSIDFEVKGEVGDCADFSIEPFPTQIDIRGEAGVFLPMSLEEGNICIDQSSGYAQAEDVSTLQIYPNPAKESLDYFVENEGSEYQLLNAHSQTVLSGNCTTQACQLSLTGLPAGEYFLTVTENGKKRSVVKVLKVE